MSPVVQEELIRQVMQQSGNEVSIAWQGGEPVIMRLDFYKRAIELEMKYGHGQAVSNGFQTNGTPVFSVATPKLKILFSIYKGFGGCPEKVRKTGKIMRIPLVSLHLRKAVRNLLSICCILFADVFDDVLISIFYFLKNFSSEVRNFPFSSLALNEMAAIIAL